MLLGHSLRRLLEDNAPDSWLPESDEELSTGQIALFIGISMCLVIIAGLVSGLTLGLMSLDVVELEVLKRSGTPDEKRCAAIIMPVIKNQHFLLVTLLLCNAGCTEALPLFIDRLADPFTAIVVSVTSVLVFGEIIPQAICSRYGLKVGASAAWFVRALMFLCAPLAYPIGKLLDFLLGSEHSALFRRAQLKALVDVHSTSAGFGGTLSEQEIAVIRGALDLTAKTAVKSMTPLDKVFMLSSEDRLDERTMQAILLSGHSRIPVYREGNRKEIIGLLLSKELVLVDPADHLTVSQLKIRQLPRLSADTPMYDMLKLFETGKSHMALLTLGNPEGPADGKHALKHPHGKNGIVDQSAKRAGPGSGPNTFHSNSFRNGGYGKDDDTGHAGSIPTHGAGVGYMEGVEGEPIGIITIEDVIEELLQEEIIDETDLFVDNLQATRVNAAEVTGTLPPRLQRMLNAGLFTPRVGCLGAPQKRFAGIGDDVPNRQLQVEVVGSDGQPGKQQQQHAGGDFLIPLVPVHEESKSGSEVESLGSTGGPKGLPWLSLARSGSRKVSQTDKESSLPLLNSNSSSDKR